MVLDLAVCIWCEAGIVDHPSAPAHSHGELLVFSLCEKAKVAQVAFLAQICGVYIPA